MLATDVHDQLTVARMLEFWAKDTAWQRRLWSVGSLAVLGEVLESAVAAQDAILSEKSLDALTKEALKTVARDPGVGDAVTRDAIRKLLTSSADLDPRRANWHSLREIVPSLRSGYLLRWAAELRGHSRPGPERTARQVAAHLLEAGFSPSYLHRWLTYHSRHNPETLTCADIVDLAAEDLVGRPPRTFTLVVPCVSVPLPANPPPEWEGPAAMAARIAQISGAHVSFRQNGGFVLDVPARDQDGAVELALEQIGRWTARIELGTRRTITLADHVWIQGDPNPVPVNRTRRGVEVGALSREHLLYARGHETAAEAALTRRIDESLQLLQPLESGPRSAAISGGWAALESLLVSPGEPKGIAAERLAAIVACSWPRAELTTVSYAYAGSDDPLSLSLGFAADNLERSRAVVDAIAAGSPFVFRNRGHDAALDRLREAIADPARVLGLIRDYLGAVLRRLYRQRNLLLHGGRVSGFGRAATLLTAPPIVGAGIDRIVHAAFVEGLPPIELAARSELRLSLLGSAAGPHLAELLEPSRLA